MSGKVEITFEQEPGSYEVFAYYRHAGSSERILLGVLPPNQAQNTAAMYSWCAKRAALLGLDPLWPFSIKTGIAITRPESIAKLFGGN